MPQKVLHAVHRFSDFAVRPMIVGTCAAMADDSGVTNEVILDHIRAFGSCFDSLEKKVDSLGRMMGGVEKRIGRVELRLEKVEKRLDNIDAALQSLYEKRVETVGRLDRNEFEELPTISSTLVWHGGFSGK